MKKLIFLLFFVVAAILGANQVAFAQEPQQQEAGNTATVTETPAAAAPAEEQSFHQVLKTKFIEGGWEWMAPVLVCLILGMAIALERTITLNLATTNTDALVKKVEEALRTGGTEAAVKVTKAIKGPVASIFTQGLSRVDSEGIEGAEKAVVAYGSVEMGRLEKGLVWISLFIALAPMLGFLGTVVGMIQAFDAIEAAGDISPSLVAGGIKVALITTVGGLIVAMILQLLYNYLVSQVDGLVNQMEESSIQLVDLLVKYRKK